MVFEDLFGITCHENRAKLSPCCENHELLNNNSQGSEFRRPGAKAQRLNVFIGCKIPSPLSDLPA
jgi:hypothetical protein